VAVGIFFAVAILATAGRITVSLCLRKRLHMDDWLLLGSCAFLIAATGILYYAIDTIFYVAALSLNPSAVLAATSAHIDMLKEIVYFQRMNLAYLALNWTSIFAVKMGFLAFFRHLVDRIRFLYAFWKGVLAFTVVAFLYSVCESLISCPHLGLESSK
jgi:hypothetical protein